MSNTVRFTLVLTIVCLGAAGGVGGIYLVTKGPIAEKARLTEEQARAQVLPGATTFEAIDEEAGVYAGRDADGKLVGYVAIGAARGYGGMLRLMLGLDGEGRVVKTAVLSHSETPGLGAELTKVQSEDTLWKCMGGGKRTPGKAWTDRLSGKAVDQLEIGKGVDAKTGCTITSRGITEAAKDAIRNIREHCPEKTN